MKSVMVYPEKCIGCKQCEIACAVAHSESKNIYSMFSEKIISKPRIHVEVGSDLLTFPNKCRHCNPAPCVEVCPTSALYRDKNTDSVLIDYGKCITCGMCAIVCPFGIISFGKIYKITMDRDVNTKCDNCIDRQKEGLEPACVEACKTNALVFGDINKMMTKKRKNIAFAVTKSPDDPEKEIIPGNIRLWREMLKNLNHSNRE